MADDERLTNWRQLPPVPDDFRHPERLSQTLLGHADKCKRAAYLYLKHGGGTPAHELDFGTAAHLAFERLVTELVVSEEATFYAPAEGEDPAAAARGVASLTAALVDEILREHPELTVPTSHKTHSVDHLREQAYHHAVTTPIDPLQVVALEQKMVFTLPSGIVVSGKIDVAEYLGPQVGGVSDYKTSFSAESEGEFEEKFQCKLYALLYCFGTPLDPDGQPLPRIGDGIEWVRARELYPRLAPRDGRMRETSTMYSRQYLSDWIPDLDLLASDLLARTESREFPAVPGSHCSMCPCQPECPLPAHLRRHAGEINDMEQAVEACEWLEVTKAEVASTEKEVKAFAKAWGPIRYGRDKVREFREQESFDTDWRGLEVAVAESVNFGVPFELDAHRRRRVSTRFVSRTLAPAELESAGEDETEVLDERFGSDAPF